MKPLVLATALLGLFATVSSEYCFNDVISTCSVAGSGTGEIQNCNAKFSAVHQVLPEFYKFVQQHITNSFQYLLMSTNFGNYEKNREGLSKLYRKLSDETWEDSIELVKYITKRGGTMNFDAAIHEEPNKAFRSVYEMYELESLSRALDMHKHLAETAHKIHSEVTKRKIDYHDAETISYLEKEFVHKHADQIRELAGHTNDLSNLIQGAPDSSLSVFLFDEYLQKIV